MKPLKALQISALKLKKVLNSALAGSIGSEATTSSEETSQPSSISVNTLRKLGESVGFDYEPAKMVSTAPDGNGEKELFK